MNLDALDTFLAERDEPSFRGTQIRSDWAQQLRASYGAMTAVPKSLRADLAEAVPLSTLTVAQRQQADDGTVKLGMCTEHDAPLEAVLMRFPGSERLTACLSSQSGCAFKCTFCATGAMGFGRHLTRWEIVDQFAELARIHGERPDNVVMMGMGEPLHNYDEVLAALRLLNDPQLFGLGARRIAISTVGWVPGIDRLAGEDFQVKLALSLHAPNDELRTQLMPVNKRYPLTELLAACRRYREKTGRRIFVEYLLLDGVNDQPEHARQLARLLGPEGYHVNLIAYNPTGAGYQRAPEETVDRFRRILREEGLAHSYRLSRGKDIDAACGQLSFQAPAAG